MPPGTQGIIVRATGEKDHYQWIINWVGIGESKRTDEHVLELVPHGEEGSCECGSIPVFGIAPEDDPRFFGGHVDAHGIRHDPLRHAEDCSKLTRCAECGRTTLNDYLCQRCRDVSTA